MIDIKGKKYLSPKEAANRYGLSMSWFAKARRTRSLPYVKLEGKGKVLYPMDETDAWFDTNIKKPEF